MEQKDTKSQVPKERTNQQYIPENQLDQAAPERYARNSIKQLHSPNAYVLSVYIYTLYIHRFRRINMTT